MKTLLVSYASAVIDVSGMPPQLNFTGFFVFSVGSPSACTSTASLSGCSGHMGEPELEINISIKEEELEIRLPIEDDEKMHAGPRTRPGA